MVVAAAEGSFWVVEGADRRPQSRAFTPCAATATTQQGVVRSLERASERASEQTDPPGVVVRRLELFGPSTFGRDPRDPNARNRSRLPESRTRAYLREPLLRLADRKIECPCGTESRSRLHDSSWPASLAAESALAISGTFRRAPRGSYRRTWRSYRSSDVAYTWCISRVTRRPGSTRVSRCCPRKNPSARTSALNYEGGRKTLRLGVVASRHGVNLEPEVSTRGRRGVFFQGRLDQSGR